MVRPWVQLERLDGNILREYVYLQTLSTVADKAKEMSSLTGSDLLFLTFSPSGSPTIYLGDNTDMVNIMTRFSEVPYQDRERRRLHNLKTIKVNYQNKEYMVDVDTLHKGWKARKLEAVREESDRLKEKLASLNHRKSLWENPRNASSFEMIKEMEKAVLRSIEGVRKWKEELKVKEALRRHHDLNGQETSKSQEEMLMNQSRQPYEFDDSSS